MPSPKPSPGADRLAAARSALQLEQEARLFVELPAVMIPGDLEAALAGEALTVGQRSRVSDLIERSKRERKMRRSEPAAAKPARRSVKERKEAMQADWTPHDLAKIGSGEGVALRASTAVAIAAKVVDLFGGRDHALGDIGWLSIVREIKGRPSVMWCDRQTGLWSEGGVVASVHIQTVIRELMSFAVSNWEPPEVLALTRRWPALQTASFEERVIEMIPTVAEMADRWYPVLDRSEFNRSRTHLGTPLGVLDLRSQKLIEPDRGRLHRISLSTGIHFHPDAEHEGVALLTAHLPPDVEEFLYEALGYALLGRSTRRFYVFAGQGGAGKSSFCAALKGALGGYAESLGTASFSRPARASDAVTSASYASVGQRFVGGVRIAYEDEPPASALDTARMKKITGGGLLDWRSLHGDWRQDRLTATPILSANNTRQAFPKMGLDDEALRDRVAVIEFPLLTEAQKGKVRNIEDMLGDEGFRSAFLARCVKAASDAIRRCESTDWSPPTKIKAVAAAIEAATAEEAGDIGRVAARIVPDRRPGAALSFGAVWEAWGEACGEASPTAGKFGGYSKRGLRPAIERWVPGLAGYRRRRIDGKTQHGWPGFRLLPPEEAPAPKAAAATATSGDQASAEAIKRDWGDFGGGTEPAPLDEPDPGF